MTEGWTVYTVERCEANGAAPEMFNIIATKWTAEGATTGRKVAKILNGGTADEAAALAATMQRGYDRLRNALAS